MDRSGEYSKGLIALMMMLSLVLSGLLFFETDTVTDAKIADDKDSYGYYWMDNRDPDPKTDYSWINVRGVGTELAIYSSGGYDVIALPWNFPLYGVNHQDIFVGSRGLIWFQDIGYAPSSYSSFPTYEVSPSIACYWSYPYNDYNSYGGVHYLTGTDDIGKYVVIEWNTNSYSQTYELILWETGLVKMQYNNLGSTSGYNDGTYACVGLDGGSESNIYSSYGTSGVYPGMAIEFSYGSMTLDPGLFKIVNGGGPNNHTAFAENGLTEFSFEVIDSEGYGDISSARIYFGDPSMGIYLKYAFAGGLPSWTIGGGGQYLDFNASRSLDRTQVLSNYTGLKLTVFVDFSFYIPLNGNLSVWLWARGKTSLPSITEVEDAFYLDSQVKLDGELVVLNEMGLPLKNEAFTKESENLTFTGVKLVYNSTNLVCPPNSSFYFRILDDELIEFVDRNASGRQMDIWLLMPTLAIRKVFNVDLRYGDGDIFPEGKFIGEFPTYAFRVDDSTPIAPASLVIRADSFKDGQREYDNDDTLYISWSSVKDSGSGVAKYRIWTTYAPGDPNIPYVDSKVTQYIWNGTTEGVFRVFIWAEDGVGHAGDWKEASIIIDKKDVYFTEFTPDPRDFPWLRTLTPDISIDVKDNLTVSGAATGVRPSTVEYAVSTTGIENFEEWISADLYDPEIVNPIDVVEVDLKPRFVEGRENYIRFRAKDYAGNGYAYSDTYNLKIDVTPVQVQDFFPIPDVWHDLGVITSRDIECYLYDETSGIRTTALYYRIGTGYDPETDTYTWATGIPQQQGWQKLLASEWDRVNGNKLIHISIPYEGYQEGDQNFIQLMFRDEAGNGNYLAYFGDMMSISPLYQIYVNTQPVAIIKEPQPLDMFWITDRITFDASDSYDVDVDEGNLKFQWFCVELNKTLGYDMVLDDVRFPAEGFYNITLYVGDSVHRYDPISKIDTRSVAKVRIYIDVWVPPYGEDLDKDNMDDGWEYDHFLTLGYNDANEDADNDGFTNIVEFQKGTDPQDPTSYPTLKQITPDKLTVDAPFGFWLFMAIIAASIIVGAVIVLLGYLRIHRLEQQEQTEEAEEEAMLATPQLDIPAMPPLPMVDTSIPTLPAAGQVQTEALPPVQEAAVPPIEPAPMEGYQEPPVPEPVPETPAYPEAAQPPAEDPPYGGPQ